MSRGSVLQGGTVVAERYARALFEVVTEQKLDAEKVAEELSAFATFLEQHAELQRVLSATTVPAPVRVSVLDAVTSTEKFVAPVQNTLRVLTKKERIQLVSIVCSQYRKALDAHNNVESGEVVSVSPLSEKQKTALAQRLGEATGKTMQLSYRQDPILVGGLVVQIGNRVYDASVLSQLEGFRHNALSSI